MAQYSKLIVTKQGQELMAEFLAGTGGSVRFTKISVSAAEYDLSEAESLTELSDVRQRSLISHAEKSDEGIVTVEAAFTNEQLTEGYYMRAIGLYAEAPNGGEMLFAVTVEQSGNCYMPQYNGTTVSGTVVKLIVAVGNAENISIEISSAAVATVADVDRMDGKLDAHNADPNAHGAILGDITQLEGEVYRLEGEVEEMKLRIDTNITANPFSVTFDTLDGLNVSGVFNTERSTVDF